MTNAFHNDPTLKVWSRDSFVDNEIEGYEIRTSVASYLEFVSRILKEEPNHPLNNELLHRTTALLGFEINLFLFRSGMSEAWIEALALLLESIHDRLWDQGLHPSCNGPEELLSLSATMLS